MMPSRPSFGGNFALFLIVMVVCYSKHSVHHLQLRYLPLARCSTTVSNPARKLAHLWPRWSRNGSRYPEIVLACFWLFWNGSKGVLGGSRLFWDGSVFFSGYSVWVVRRPSGSVIILDGQTIKTSN